MSIHYALKANKITAITTL